MSKHELEERNIRVISDHILTFTFVACSIIDTDTDIYFQIPQYKYKFLEIQFTIVYTKYVRNLRDQDSLNCFPLGPTIKDKILFNLDYKKKMKK